VRSLLVPALSLQIGRTLWWPSALAKKEDAVHTTPDGSAILNPRSTS